MRSREEVDRPMDLDLSSLTPSERSELESLVDSDPVPWRPLEGPQTMAFNSEATVCGYGGAAGGGKTDLACGLAVTKHQKVGIFRAIGTELTAIIDRLGELLGGRDGFSQQQGIWRFDRWDGVPAQIELGSFPNPGDHFKYRGRPHDLLVFDEASGMREFQVRFLMGWLRTVDPKQRLRCLMTFNPPTETEGRWVLNYFAPWLDKKYPNPAEPGELRWFVTKDGLETEVEGPEPFEHEGELLTPLSRTFIPSRIADNPFLEATGYKAMLMGLPEPLRSQMLHGDFAAGMEDDPWQVIPTLWVEAAMERWSEPVKKDSMDSLGCDVARGGRDKTVISARHGMWFDRLKRYPGGQTVDGPAVAGLCMAAQRDGAPIHIDVIGVGASPYDFLRDAGIHVLGVNVAEQARGMDESGRLKFFNYRSELWWRMREALDPKNDTGICLPPDSKLLSDLTAPRWQLSGGRIKVDSREDLLKELGRSPDDGTAVIMALIDTPKVEIMTAIHREAMKEQRMRQSRNPWRQREPTSYNTNNDGYDRNRSGRGF